jgi:methyl-accepting chemotaxis protein
MAGPTKKELEVILTLKNRMSTEVKRVERDMDSMGRKGKKASKETGDGFEWIRKKAAGAASAIKGMINPITLLGGALGAGALFALSKGLSEAAASAEELDSKFQAIFGDETRNMATWVDELSTSVKRGRQELRLMVADTQPFIERLVGAGEASRDTTKALTQLAVDVASFYDMADQDVLTRFRSAWLATARRWTCSVAGSRLPR